MLIGAVAFLLMCSASCTFSESFLFIVFLKGEQSALRGLSVLLEAGTGDWEEFTPFISITLRVKLSLFPLKFMGLK